MALEGLGPALHAIHLREHLVHHALRGAVALGGSTRHQGVQLVEEDDASKEFSSPFLKNFKEFLKEKLNPMSRNRAPLHGAELRARWKTRRTARSDLRHFKSFVDLRLQALPRTC